MEVFVFSSGFEMPFTDLNRLSNPFPLVPPLAPNLGFSHQLLQTLSEDKSLIEILRPNLLKAEIKGLNDALGDYKRDSHRGKHAEEEVWPLLGPPLRELGFSHSFENQQGRFLNLNRYSWPVRLLYCRAQEVDGAFTVWRKGESSQDLFNDNKRQLLMFPPVSQHAKERAEPVHDVIWNVWILAVTERVKIEANLYDEELVVHLVYPLSIQKPKSIVARYHLLCDARLEIFRESLGQAPISIGELPEATQVDVPEPEERDLDEQSLA